MQTQTITQSIIGILEGAGSVTFGQGQALKYQIRLKNMGINTVLLGCNELKLISKS